MRSFVVVTLVALLAAAPVAAQQSDTTGSRDSTRADSARAQRLTPMVVSGTRLTTSADERTPEQVDLIRLRDVPPSPVGAAAALERLPGVSLSNDQGTRAQPTLDVRGFTLSPVVGVPQGISVFLDGVRINEPDAQELNFDLIPMEAVEHAELVRGPNAIFGKNTLAGALNLFTARGGATPRVEGSVSGGSFGYREAHVIASGARDGYDGYLLAKGSTEDGYQELSGSTTRQIFATVGRKRDSSDVALSLLYAHDRIHEAGSLPASWFDVARRANYTGGDFFRPDLVQGSARATLPLGGAQLRANLFARRNAIEQYNVNVDDPNTRAFITNTSLGGTAELEIPARLAGRDLALTVGGEYARNKVKYRLFDEPNAAAPDLPAECDQGSGLCEDARVNGDDGAIYAQALWQTTSRLSLLASGRGDWVRVPFRDLRQPASSGTSTFWRFSPKVGATYAFSQALRGYVSVASGFRAPAALELACASADAPCPLPFSLGADPPLDPVVAWNYEAGIDWEPWDGATLDVVGFRMDVRDEIVFVTSATAAGYFQNIPRTRRDGAEGSFTVRLPANVRAFGSYTFLDATYRSAATLASALGGNVVGPGDQFAQSPRHRVTAGVGATKVLGTMVLDGALSMRAVSSSFLRGDEANREPTLPGYAVADLRLSLEHEHFSVSADVGNLFDRRYAIYGVYGENPKGPFGGPPPAEPAVERWYTPAYPRTVTLSVSVK
ncbi:MAG TPA: TonB-dependent receptor [Gemmatimonadaceae bacterium]